MSEQENINPHHRHDIAEKLRAMGVMPGRVDPSELESGRRTFRAVEILLMVLVAVAFIWFIYYLNKENGAVQTSEAVSSSEATSKTDEAGSGREASSVIGTVQSTSTDKAVASTEQSGKESATGKGSANGQTVKSSETARQSTESSSVQGATVRAPVVPANPYIARPGAIQPSWWQRPGSYPQFNAPVAGSAPKADQATSDQSEATGKASQEKKSAGTVQQQPGYAYPYAAPPYRGYYPYPPPGYRPYAPWQQQQQK